MPFAQYALRSHLPTFSAVSVIGVASNRRLQDESSCTKPTETAREILVRK
jgi:hypothetical protein